MNCRNCGSFHFLDTPETDGVRILETPPNPRPCPRCSSPLAPAQLDDAHAECCTTCRCVLLPRPDFAHVVHTRRTWATGQPVPPAPLNRADLERAVACPSFTQRMATHPYYGPGNVIIDSCDRCEVVWLDYGELKQIAEAPGADRGVRKPRQRPNSDTVVHHSRSGLADEPAGGVLDFLVDLLP